MTTTTTRATTTTTGASTQSSALISEQILAFKRFTEASSASALSELIASTSTSKSSSRSQSRSDVVLISDQDWSTMTAQTTNNDNNNHPSMIDLIVEQFLKSSEEFLIKESLEKMKLMFYTQCTLKEGDEEEEESFGKQIANMLNKSELDDLDNKIDQTLEIFSVFASEVEELKKIASAIASRAFVNQVVGEAYKNKENNVSNENEIGDNNNQMMKTSFIKNDVDSSKRKFEQKFDDLVEEVIVACGPRNLTRILALYYAKLFARFRNASEFPLDEDLFIENNPFVSIHRRSGKGATNMSENEENDSEEEEEEEIEEDEVQANRRFVKNLRKSFRNSSSPEKILGKELCKRINSAHKDAILKHFKKYSHEAFEIAADFAIKHFALKFAQANFKASTLKCVVLYSRVVPMQIAKTVYGFEAIQFGNEAPSTFSRKFTSSSKEHLGTLRIEELFDIVVDYPDSLGAVKDLRMCLSDDRQFSLRESLVAKFTEQLRRRLLHPGARTADVISQYIGTIKTMRDLDPSGIVLDLVSGPIRKYLRRRKDTIRCVVTMLTDDGSGGNEGGTTEDGDNNTTTAANGGFVDSSANALFAELGAMAREELKNKEDDHDHNMRARSSSKSDFNNIISNKNNNEESGSSDLDEGDHLKFNMVRGYNSEDDNKAEEDSSSESSSANERADADGGRKVTRQQNTKSLLKSQDSGMDAILDYESKQLSRTLTGFGVDQLQNAVFDRTESGVTWGKNFGTPAPLDILSRQKKKKKETAGRLQKAGEVEVFIPDSSATNDDEKKKLASSSSRKKILKRFPGDAWDPEPVISEATKLRSRKRRQLRDIIGLLIGIYGGKELFVNEYRFMLADKLLQKSNYDAERETLALELLKNKFGEAHLHDCEVMLRDVQDSRRVNANVKTRPAEGTPLAKEGIRVTEMLKESPVQALIISRLYWPKDIAKGAQTIIAPLSTSSILPSQRQQHQNNSNDVLGRVEEDVFDDPLGAGAIIPTRTTTTTTNANEDSLMIESPPSLSSSPPRIQSINDDDQTPLHNDIILPPAIEEAMRAYEKRYHELKAPRKMTWIKSLGRVVVEVSLNEKTFEMVVSPLHAAILYHFTNKERWTADELAKVLNATTKAVRQRMVLWMNKGVILEINEAVYELNTSNKIIDSTQSRGVSTEENDSEMQNFAEETEAAEMKVYEQYVMGMLTNFPSMPIERIHNMLKMFVVEPAYDKTQTQLEKFLNALVRAEKLSHDGENFSKRK